MEEANITDEWEISKENVVPLKQGRSIQSLNSALKMGPPQHNHRLELMRKYDVDTRNDSKRTRASHRRLCRK